MYTFFSFFFGIMISISAYSHVNNSCGSVLLGSNSFSDLRAGTIVAMLQAGIDNPTVQAIRAALESTSSNDKTRSALDPHFVSFSELMNTLKSSHFLNQLPTSSKQETSISNFNAGKFTNIWEVFVNKKIKQGAISPKIHEAHEEVFYHYANNRSLFIDSSDPVVIKAVEQIDKLLLFIFPNSRSINHPTKVDMTLLSDQDFLSLQKIVTASAYPILIGVMQ